MSSSIKLSFFKKWCVMFINIFEVPMSYDKTIGGDDFTFSGTLSGTPQTALQLLAGADQTELLTALYTNGSVNEAKICSSVDGWIYSSSSFLTCHKVGGAAESIAADTKYPMPVAQWHTKRLFYGSIAQ